MEYLLSLVGKDQKTITEVIKELAVNSEKVNALEKEDSDLHIELEESKEEIHYLKNKLNQKYDMIEDLERELDKNEEKFEEAKKRIISKEKELDEMEKVIAEQVEENNIVRDNNLSMVSQIAEHLRMEKKIYIQIK